MDALTTAAQSYMGTFYGYLNQFLSWGQELFFSLVVINIVWLALWHAFDRHGFAESMPSFIKQFFIIALFYTIMMNPSWLFEILKTAQYMGSTLTHAPIDPSSIVSQGIGIANKIITPVEQSSLLTAGFSLIILSIVYIVVLFVFISIALELALTLIITTALISIASFFLGFAALGATTQIARQTLDVILGNCVKLLGIYLVVAAGSQTLVAITNSIPTTVDTLKTSGFDPYVWVVVATVLFWLLAKNFPNQLAKIVTGAIQESRGTDAAAFALTAARYAQTAMPAVKIAGGAASGIAKIAGSTMHNAGAHFNQTTSASCDLVTGLGMAVGGSLAHLGKAVAGNVSDHFKEVANKLAGGPGSQQPIRSVSERMYNATQDIKSSSGGGSPDAPSQATETSKPPPSGGAGQPSSAGRTSAGSSSLRSEPKSDGTSRPKP